MSAYGDDLGVLFVSLGRVGQHYPRSGSLLAFNRPQQHARSQRLEPHAPTSSMLCVFYPYEKAKPSSAIRQCECRFAPRKAARWLTFYAHADATIADSNLDSNPDNIRRYLADY